MTQEQTDLLFKDLCARLPYGVKVGTTDNDVSLKNVWEVLWYNTFTEDIKLINYIDIDVEKIVDISEIRPYLFPMSSMTEEQNKEYRKVCELDTEILVKHPMDDSPFPALYNSQD